MSLLRPTNILADRKQRILSITWSDGHQSELPFAGLRAICPCAECKGGHESMGELPDPHLVRDIVDKGLIWSELSPWVRTRCSFIGVTDIRLVSSPGHFCEPLAPVQSAFRNDETRPGRRSLPLWHH